METLVYAKKLAMTNHPADSYHCRKSVPKTKRTGKPFLSFYLTELPALHDARAAVQTCETTYTE
ncbi:hypothetical protein CAter10_3913 [Collimonas arenae]|nr:hypothetical protein CAter10_3913 [Collimonas arenae]